ncbi:MAG: serine hydrolase, partial [Cyclobacteriaceae bacterium]|nr:serine hydrolase [Cyclobacteriaceae bacterium]
MRVIILILLVFSINQFPEKESKSSLIQDFSAIEKFINDEHEKGNFSGSIVIGDREGVLFQKHAGLANRVWNIPVESTTRFDIASINKSFIAALILKAVEEYKLSLDSKLV